MPNHEFDVDKRVEELLLSDFAFGMGEEISLSIAETLMHTISREVRAAAISACSRNGCHLCGGAIQRDVRIQPEA